jgi:hypothetical protein
MANRPANVEVARPAGFALIGGFFYFGAVMASYAATTLLFPGTVLDRGWKLNPTAYVQLHSMGRVMGVPFVILGFALLMAAVGWFKRRRWGWVLGTAIIAVNAIGDLGNMIRGEWVKGAVGVVLAALLLMYMTRRQVRKYFVSR